MYLKEWKVCIAEGKSLKEREREKQSPLRITNQIEQNLNLIWIKFKLNGEKKNNDCWWTGSFTLKRANFPLSFWTSTHLSKDHFSHRCKNLNFSLAIALKYDLPFRKSNLSFVRFVDRFNLNRFEARMVQKPSTEQEREKRERENAFHHWCVN